MIESDRYVNQLNDAELILRVRNDCRDSEGELYLRHKTRALTLADYYTDTPSEAEDIVAESFFRVFDSLRRGLGPDEFFQAYLLTVVSREAFARNDAASKEFLTDEFTQFETRETHRDEGQQRVEALLIVKAYKSLAERWRAVLWYTEIEGMRPREIAPLLGVTPNAVATLALRAREALREAYLAAHLNETVNLASTCAATRKKMPSMIRGSASNRNQRRAKKHLNNCSDCFAVFNELNEVGLNFKAYASLMAGFIPIILGWGAPHTLGFAHHGISNSGTTDSTSAETIKESVTSTLEATLSNSAQSIVDCPVSSEFYQWWLKLFGS